MTTTARRKSRPAARTSSRRVRAARETKTTTFHPGRAIAVGVGSALWTWLSWWLIYVIDAPKPALFVGGWAVVVAIIISAIRSSR